jgi:beta-D-xylosidase 4
VRIEAFVLAAYTSFTYALHHAPDAVSLAPVRRVLAHAADEERTFVPLEASRGGASLALYAVNVTNTGSVDSDDVVLGFITPPNAGKDGAPLKSLFGFERVHVRAGATVTVWLYPAATDFAPVDAAGACATPRPESTRSASASRRRRRMVWAL